MSTDEAIEKRKHRLFTVDFKLRVIKKARAQGIESVAELYCIDRRVISGWVKKENELWRSKMRDTKRVRVSAGGRKPQFPDLENRLRDWIMQRDACVSTKAVQDRAMKLAAMYRIRNFSASTGWLMRFLARKRIRLSRTQKRGRKHKFEFLAMSIRHDSIEEDAKANAEQHEAPIDYELDFEMEGCRCEQGCSAASGCDCVTRYGANYDEHGRLSQSALESGRLIIECGSGCACNVVELLEDDELALGIERKLEIPCANRVVQNGARYELEVFDSQSGTKQKGLRCQTTIERGDFVTEYCGELISPNEARRRFAEYANVLNAPSYIMIVNEFFATLRRRVTTICDARNFGSLARFINHSCEPNLLLVPVRVDSFRYPRFAFFAARRIEAYEELTFDYATMQMDTCQTSPVTISLGDQRCECESVQCRGFLPLVPAAL